MKMHMLVGSLLGAIGSVTHAEMPYKIEYPAQTIVPMTKIQVLRSGRGQPSHLEVYTAVIDVRHKGQDYHIERYQETVQAEQFEPTMDVPKVYPKRTIVPISKTEITQTQMRGAETRAREKRHIEALGVELDANHNYTVKELKMQQDTQFNEQQKPSSVTHVETKTGGYADQDILIIKGAVPEDE